MSVVFIGTVVFSRFALKGLLDARAPLKAVFTLDPSLQRGVSDFATFEDLLEGSGVPLLRVQNINAPEGLKTLKEIRPDFIYCIGWSRIVRPEILACARKGAMGLHPTLLPEGRGRAPIPWTILKGLSRSGVSLFYLAEAADAGDIIRQVSYDIPPDETATTLYQKVCEATYDLVKTTYPLLAKGVAPRTPQDETRATYWTKRTPEDGWIDWRKSSEEIERLIRAVTHPYPGAFSYWKKEKILIWKAKRSLIDKTAKPGTVVAVEDGGVLVKTGDGVLQLEKDAAEVLSVGEVLHAAR